MATYIVISKPKRISAAVGVSHFMVFMVTTPVCKFKGAAQLARDLCTGRGAGNGNVIQNSAFIGLIVENGSVVRTINLKTQNNVDAGAAVFSGGNLTVYSSSFVSNAGSGIDVSFHSTLRIFSSSVQGNAGNGISLRDASEARVLDSSINNNGGAGVSIGDLSFGSFAPFAPSNVTSNHGAFDVVCLPQFSATRGARANIGGGSTNCVEP